MTSNKKIKIIKKTYLIINEYKRFIKYLIVGGLNVVVAFITYYLLVYADYHYQIANMASFITSSFHGYIWNKLWVFGDRKIRSHKSFIKYYTVYISSLIICLFISHLWVEILNYSMYVLPFVTLLFSVPYNYGLNKAWTFNLRKNRI